MAGLLVAVLAIGCGLKSSPAWPWRRRQSPACAGAQAPGLCNQSPYAKHVIFHPYDGFWDLKHEKRGTLRAALTIVGLVAVTYVVMRQYTGFIFNPRDLSRLNVIVELLSVLAPFFLWAVVNWALTTLMDGKGTFRDIIIATAYALVPFVLINLPLTL